MQTLHASPLNGVVPVQYPIIQSVARNQWIDVNNESAVTLSVSLGGRVYLIPPNTTARYAMDNTETFVTFTPQSAADPAKDTVSGTIYNEQDSVPVEVERGANASDILPITSAMIADGAIIAAKVATAAINTANIVAGAVGTAQLANGAVTNPILAALAVANSNIQASAVQTANIADGNVTTTKIANLAVTTALIANAAVGTAQIANAAITTALIQTAAITDALIANVSAGKITAGTISAAISIISPTITGGLFRTASSGQRIEISSTTLDRIKYFTGLAGETTPAQILWGSSLQLISSQFSAVTPAQILIFSDYLGGIPQVTVEGAVVRLQADAFGTGGVAQAIQMDGRSPGSITITGTVTFNGNVATTIHLVGNAGEPAFQNGWSNFAGGFSVAKFWKDPNGVVHISGLIQNAAASTSTIFTLPVGFRPPANIMFICSCNAGNGNARLDVHSDGTFAPVTYWGGSNASYFSLDGISFQTS